MCSGDVDRPHPDAASPFTAFPVSSVVDAVIFDIDGTLLDSAAGIVAGFQHTLQVMGIETEEVLHSEARRIPVRTPSGVTSSGNSVSATS